jgi:hypothetical protein
MNLEDFGEGQMQIATVTDLKVARLSLQLGWKWYWRVKPFVETNSCQVRHTGYVVSGLPSAAIYRSP